MRLLEVLDMLMKWEIQKTQGSAVTVFIQAITGAAVHGTTFKKAGRKCLGKMVVLRGLAAAVEVWNYLTSSLGFFGIILQKCYKRYERK